MSSELLRLREVMDKAVENKDRTSMQEELGDLLLQVYFHSRMAEEDADNPFNVEDVAKTVTDKLIRRHPHVFGGTKVESSSEVLENWEAQKAAEKGRTSIIDGVPLAQPALPLAAKVLYRMNKLNFELEVDKPTKISEQLNQDQFGDLLLGLIAQAVDLGIDPEAALRTATKSLISKIQEHEAR